MSRTLALFAWLAACIGCSESPASSASQGTGGAGSIPVCERKTRSLAACVRAPGTISAAVDLTVRGTRAETTATCFVAAESQVATFPSFLPAGLQATAGWELEDPAGGTWLLELASPGLPETLLAAGAAIRLHLQQGSFGSLGGYLVVERAGALRLAYFHHRLPQHVNEETVATLLDGLRVEAAHTECLLAADPACEGVRSAAEVHAGSASAVLATGESALIADLHVTNDFLGTGGGSGCLDFQNDISIGVHRVTR
jgi:hypothetical protein